MGELSLLVSGLYSPPLRNLRDELWIVMIPHVSVHDSVGVSVGVSVCNSVYDSVDDSVRNTVDIAIKEYEY
jgi:hypothetical protein